MALFFTKEIWLDIIHQVIVPAADIDRDVQVAVFGGETVFKFGNADSTEMFVAMPGRLVLPAGEELLARRKTATASKIDLMVTSIGR